MAEILAPIRHSKPSNWVLLSNRMTFVETSRQKSVGVGSEMAGFRGKLLELERFAPNSAPSVSNLG